MASATFNRALRLAGSLPRLAALLEEKGADLDHVDLESAAALAEIEQVWVSSERAAASILRDLSSGGAGAPPRSPLASTERHSSAEERSDDEDRDLPARAAAAAVPDAARPVHDAWAQLLAAPTPGATRRTLWGLAGPPPGQPPPPPPPPAAPAAADAPSPPASPQEADATAILAVDVSADALKTAHSMADARRAELAAKLRARYLARLPATEAPVRADALQFPERWNALSDFATLGTFPQTAIAGLMSGLPEVRGLPRVADWHPVLDHVPVAGLDSKVKAAAKDTQQFTRRMLRVLTAMDELVADDKLRVLLDSAAVLLGAFAAAQLDMTTEHLLARAKAGRPMDTSAYFAKVRALAKSKAAPALGSQLEELQDWADMIDHRLLGRTSAAASSTTSVANARRDRRRRTKRGPGGVVVPVSAAQTANPATASPARNKPATPAPGSPPRHEQRGRGSGPDRAVRRPHGPARN